MNDPTRHDLAEIGMETLLQGENQHAVNAPN